MHNPKCVYIVCIYAMDCTFQSVFSYLEHITEYIIKNVYILCIVHSIMYFWIHNIIINLKRSIHCLLLLLVEIWPGPELDHHHKRKLVSVNRRDIEQVYIDHMACRMWEDEDEEELKLVSYGRKLSKFGISHSQIEATMLNTRLLQLCNVGYEIVDKFHTNLC